MSTDLYFYWSGMRLDYLSLQRDARGSITSGTFGYLHEVENIRPSAVATLAIDRCSRIGIWGA